MKSQNIEFNSNEIKKLLEKVILIGMYTCV